MSAADQLGALIARGIRRPAETTSSAQVVAVDDTTGTVTLDLDGTQIDDVPCADSYTNRQAGDWVVARLAAGQPLVLCRTGPAITTQAAAVDSAAGPSIGTETPTGQGWKAARTWVNDDGRIYYQTSETDA